MNNLTDLHSLPGPESITRVALENGIIVLARPNFNSPSVVVTGYITAGNLFEPDEKLGLADFTAIALMRGTQQRNFHQIYEALESVGAGLGFGGSTHTTSFSGRALAEDLDLLLEITSQSLRFPIFPGEYVERLRAQKLTSLALRAQDTGEMASLAFDQIVYAGHPYSRPEDGYPETVRRIQVADLQAFHQSYYGPRGMVISVVGSVDPQAAIDKVERALGDWRNPQQADLPELPEVRELKKKVQKKVTIPGKSQSDLILGAVGPARRSPDYMAAALGNSVLGQFGLYGRIGESVRERSGLAYYAYSSLNGGIGPGPWYAAAGVDPGNVEATTDLILKEINRFILEPVSETELADSQAQFIGRLPLSLESNSGVASALLSLERFQLGLDYYQRYPEIVRAVTPKLVLETAQQYLDPELFAIVSAGPE